MNYNVRIREIFTCSLSCEPFVRRVANGELLCVCQCDGPTEPHPENRVYVFHSADNGETWSQRTKIMPEDGRAVYCTEVSVVGDEITAYLTVHAGRFVGWDCVRMISHDSGYTWENAGPPPCFPDYTFIRSRIRLSDGTVLIPYQHYPVDRNAEKALRLRERFGNVTLDDLHCDWVESGVLRSTDGGKTFRRHDAVVFDMREHWIWSEPTICEFTDGRVAMLLRRCGSGWLWYSESSDGGITWSEVVKTEIPNPTNKPKLLRCGNRIVLLHTPNNESVSQLVYAKRYPLAMWVSDDDMKTWKEKIILTDFPGSYSYCDGFYEDGHVRFAVEHNRHTILYFDVDLGE